MTNVKISDATCDYRYFSGDLGPAHRYLLPAVKRVLAQKRTSESRQRVFDLGCGNGSMALEFARMQFDVVGVDTSLEGIKQANSHHPQLRLELGSAYDDLASRFGSFPFVTSLEVIEHVYYPRKFAASVYALLEDGGWAIISTPYHGYLKNLALALTGTMDSHFTALWDHGHIKFWSIRTLTALLSDAGFREISFLRVGRIPPLANSMIAIARRPKGLKHRLRA